MALIGFASYAVAAVVFALAALLLVLHWHSDLRGGLLIAAVSLTALWGAVLAWGALNPGAVVVAEVAELLRSGGWLVFISALLAPVSRLNGWLRALSIMTIALVGISLLSVLMRHGMNGPVSMQGIPGDDLSFAVPALALAVLGLILLEQLLRSLPAENRASIRFLCIGVGIILAYDVYLYSFRLLYQQMQISAWDARGLVTALAVPMILIAARRNREWEVPVFLSREVVFQTTTLLAVGGYLLMVALGGYYVRDFGGTWGAFAQIVLVAGALIGLLLLLVSEPIRRRFRVLINKHFFTRKYDYREEWLRLTERLAEAQDDLTPYERAVRVVADVVESPAGLLWRDGDQGFELSASWRIDPPAEATIPRDASLVTFLRDSEWIVDVAELDAIPARYRDMQLPDSVRRVPAAWAIVPLLYQQTLTGILLLTRPRSGGEIKWEDRDLLKTLGKQVASYLGQHENAQALAQARQFEAFNQLTAFLMHDLKNLIAQQSLIVRNADRHKHNPAFVDDAFATIGDSVKRMEHILEYMQRRRVSHLSEQVDVHHLLVEAVSRCADRRPEPSLELDVRGAHIDTDREAFAMVVIHLLRNAQDATPEEGMILLAAREEGGQVTLEVRDSGSGMSEAFIRDGLFKPFHTTKSTKGMGIGAHQVREFTQRHGGQLTVTSQVGEGTTFRLTLPTSAVESPDDEARVSGQGL
ncbi:XrtA/PEP-CTERM system histidine kinase PrsK [Spiribacter vilamensis]|uniref:histidine kinase n=1 Tax=Spiribacter vilamensis TaxID=531306 RepID=A0A4Q8CZ99_9GAMM|nr:XrtA/PEP-CTERM system histidine kinase PrsK [Spiribacter vilamensis]RZU98348.1 signal transduction histidine kinase [Spiribacter vilamensis]